MEIPRLGLGTYKSTDDEKFTSALKYSLLECKYRHIDCAPVYNNQVIIGNCLHEIFSSGSLKRDEIWITSKLWNTKHRPDLVEQSLKQTLKDLQVEYLDLFLIHWPVAFQSRTDDEMVPKDYFGNAVRDRIDIVETWKAMEEMVRKGYVKHIGLSNASIELMERIRYHKEITIQPYANQVEMHLFNQQTPLVDYCTKRGIFVTAYTCLGRNDLVGPRGYSISTDPNLLEVAKQTGKAPSQVSLRFLLQLSPFVNVIPKSVTPAYILQNSSLDFELNEEQMNLLRQCEAAFRFVDPYSSWGFDALGLGR